MGVILVDPSLLSTVLSEARPSWREGCREPVEELLETSSSVSPGADTTTFSTLLMIWVPRGSVSLSAVSMDLDNE